MKDQVALVTGGMGGIGTVICQFLNQKGARVIAGYHRGGNHQAAQQWQEQQKNLGYNLDIAYVDVSDFQSCQDMITRSLASHGRIDILVNNAGITQDTSFRKMTLDQWHEVIQTNLNSVFNMTRPLIEHMINNTYGRIINISSINGQKGQFGQTNYSAAKAGIHGFTKSLALEVAQKGITVNTVSPGYVATPMVLNVEEKYLTKIIEQIPVGRLGTPEDVARAVVFLADKAASFITGANLSINGGQYLN